VASDNDDLRNISDTARWVAIYRAIESERPDALFDDPFARRLAGERGERIAETMEFANRNAWSFVARTVVFDRFIEDSIASGADMVVNLAAGLDTRPYRMALPENLSWIEVDLPDLLAYKIAVLANEIPRCRLERVALDLANVAARRDLFNRLSQEASRVLVITEGLVVYCLTKKPFRWRRISPRRRRSTGGRSTWCRQLSCRGCRRAAVSGTWSRRGRRSSSRPRKDLHSSSATDGRSWTSNRCSIPPSG
jgi:hypothetical protein